MTTTTCRPPVPPDLSDDNGTIVLVSAVAGARCAVAEALVDLRRAAQADWASIAAEEYRARIGEVVVGVLGLQRDLTTLEAGVTTFRRASVQALDLIRADVAARAAVPAGAS